MQGAPKLKASSDYSHLQDGAVFGGLQVCGTNHTQVERNHPCWEMWSPQITVWYLRQKQLQCAPFYIN